MKILFVFLNLIFTFCLAKTNNNIAVPNEYFIAEVPNLPLIGPDRVSWVFVRPPKIWIMNQIIDLSEIKWPQWDTSQHPLSIVPGHNDIYLILFHDQNEIKRIELNKTINPESISDLKGPNPTHFQFEASTLDGRVILTSPKYEWIQRQEVFHCKAKVHRSQSVQTNQAVNSCINTLMKMPSNSQRQWYLSIHWPKTSDASSNSWIGEKNRALKKSYRLSNMIFEGSRGNSRTFSAESGVTNQEKIKLIEFPLDKLNNSQIISTAATREEKKKIIFSQSFDNAASIKIYSFANDIIDQRELYWSSTNDSQPGIGVQFVPSKNDSYSLYPTDFEQARTGVEGHLRPWNLSFLGSYDKITSNRGEEDSFFNIPGINIKYNFNQFNIKPYAFLSTGYFHQGSTLLISEFQFGVYKELNNFMGVEPGIGVQHYSLSGQNPGSSRLGSFDALAIGAQKSIVSNKSILHGQAQILISKELGYSGEIHYNRFFDFKLKDLRFFWGPILGVYRYSTRASNKLTSEQVFSENRWKIGFEFGMLGPDYFDGR